MAFDYALDWYKRTIGISDNSVELAKVILAIEQLVDYNPNVTCVSPFIKVAKRLLENSVSTEEVIILLTDVYKAMEQDMSDNEGINKDV